MDEQKKQYIAIDLKSFYASVECRERGLDPLTTNLVVADHERTEKTICLAVSPSLKAYGIPGRPRLFEVVQKVKEVNASRRYRAPGHKFTGESWQDDELKQKPELGITYIVAKPRMAYYMEYSTRIYHIYLKYIAPEDIHVYSIDEVFMDVTHYLKTYHMTAEELAKTMIKEVYEETGITATAGIGTNLYLAKIAMDILAKHCQPDAYGVRMAQLDEMSYRQYLWGHKPITDFWRVGKGYAKRLAEQNMYTMGDIARCSIGKETEYYNEDLLYDMFGVNAQLLIDHAWGWEPCTMEEIKSYRPESNSISSGQVLKTPYAYEQARIVVREMVDSLVLDLVDKQLETDQIGLMVGYDIVNVKDKKAGYQGSVQEDRYGRVVPKPAHGTVTLEEYSSSTQLITQEMLDLFDRIVNPSLFIRRLTVCANRVISQSEAMSVKKYKQLSFCFDETPAKDTTKQEQKERKIQQAMLDIKKKYGKNAILKGTNFQEGATARERNGQIGGHKA